MDFYKIAAFVSPLLAVFFTGVATYIVSIRSKRLDILYAQKVPAFKDVVAKIVQFKIYCLGRIAYYEANEFSPFFESGVAAFMHRTNIVDSYVNNQVFLSAKSRIMIEKLINDMGGICSFESTLLTGFTEDVDMKTTYSYLNEKSEQCINALYKELNLK